jgi:hypothetical protein
MIAVGNPARILGPRANVHDTSMNLSREQQLKVGIS